MKKIDLWVLLLILITGCKKSSLEVEPESFQENTAFFYELAVLYDSYVTDETIYFIGPSIYTKINKGERPVHRPISTSSKTTFPLSANLFAEHCHPLCLNFYSTQTTGSKLELNIKLRDLDSTFLNYQFSGKYLNSIGINDLDQVLIPYRTTEYTNDLKMYLISVRVEGQYKPELVGYQEIRIPQEHVDVPLTIHSINNDFYLSTNNRVYKIRSDGTWSRITERQIFIDMVEFQGNLFAHSYYDLYISEDNGETWEVFISDFPRSVDARFKVVNERLYMYGLSSIFHLKFTDDFYQAEPIDVTGLERRKITDIDVFNDTVYISTINGLFMKSVEKFHSTLNYEI